jgi:hypothetical protein
MPARSQLEYTAVIYMVTLKKFVQENGLGKEIIISPKSIATLKKEVCYLSSSIIKGRNKPNIIM